MPWEEGDIPSFNQFTKMIHDVKPNVDVKKGRFYIPDILYGVATAAPDQLAEIKEYASGTTNTHLSKNVNIFQAVETKDKVSATAKLECDFLTGNSFIFAKMDAGVDAGELCKVEIPTTGTYKGDHLLAPLETGDKSDNCAIARFVRQAGRRKPSTTTQGQIGLCQLFQQRGVTV